MELHQSFGATTFHSVLLFQLLSYKLCDKEQLHEKHKIPPKKVKYTFSVNHAFELNISPAQRLIEAASREQVQVANNQQTYIRVANCQTVRMKEEKEVLEHFAGVFTMMNPLTFKEIFQTTVPYMVERISKNYALQVSCLTRV